MISLPIEANNRTPAAVFVDNLGTYDNTKWRFFEHRGTADIEYGTTADMSPGRAFWLIVRDGGTIDTGPGLSVSTASPFPIPLNAGWTLVGNPFNFSIRVEKLSLRGSPDQVVLRSFTGNWNSPPSSITIMEPFTGYALYSAAADTLLVNPDLTVGALPLKPMAAPTYEWGVAILAECENAKDEDNLALVSPEARAGRDALDYPEPPAIGEYVSLSFPDPGVDGALSRYCWDARPVPTDGEQWKMEVRSNIRNIVRLKLRGVEEVPMQYEVWLVDDLLKTITDARLKPAYSFVNASGSSPRHLTLLIGTRDFVQHLSTERQIIPTAFELSQNFPNPFNPATTIRFGLPVASRVRLSIYNMLGQEVKTLVDETKPAGYHTAVFDGEGLASGVYVYKMQASGVDHAGSPYIETKKLLMLK
jgi:hypothetical protein